MAETMFKTAQEMLDQRRKNTQDNLLAIKAIEARQRERPLSGYAKAGGMLGEKLGTMAGEGLKDYFGIKNEGDYLRDYESGIEQRKVMEQNLRAEGSEYSPEEAAQVLAQQDRFIEESGSNLSPEIKRTSDFTRTMSGLTPEQLNNPLEVAKVYNDFGYTKEAVDLLGQNRMTPYQKAQIELQKKELELFDEIGGTINSGSTQPPTMTGEQLGLPENQSEQPETGIMDNVSELYDNALGVVNQAVSSVDAGGLYDNAVGAVNQAMTSLDDFFTRGGASNNAFNLNDYATSKGVELNTLNDLQKRQLYMQGMKDRKEAFSNRVREQSRSAVQNILPTK